MIVQTLILPLRSRLAGFAGDRRAVSAVEFAILLPVMIGFYLGSVETTEGIAISQQVALTASTIANLVSQTTTVDGSQMSDILAASSAVLTPYPVANATVVVSSITINPRGAATVAWSDTLNGTARPVGQVITLPSALTAQSLTCQCSTSVILGESTYAYTPNLGYAITGTLTLSSSQYYAPRMSTCVYRPPNVTSCPSP
jgi:Flp pilus assembly protein TadG